MKKNKIIIGIICILLVLLVGSTLLISRISGKKENQSTVENQYYAVVWRGFSYTGNYSGKWKEGCPTGEGSFRGVTYIEGKEYDEIAYTGNWEGGKFNGDGVLKQNSNNMIYKGKFKEGSLNGTIKLYEGESSVYSKVVYNMDIPRGVSYLYDKEKNILDYDYYFMGISVKEICETAEEFPYENLLYENETYRNKRIKLNCRVQDVYQDIDRYWYVKVTDWKQNEYILRYNFYHENDATSYMPELKVGQQIEVYGFCSELIQYGDEINKLPSIDALCISGFENQIFRDKKLKKTYDNLVNYPNFYKDSYIKLRGKVSGIYNISENNIFFYVESEDHNEDGKRLYICYVKNNDDNIAMLSAVTNEITIRGKMVLTRSVNMSGADDTADVLQNFPCVKVMKIATE